MQNESIQPCPVNLLPQTGSVWRDKRFIFTLGVLASVAIAFWSGSRYPALNEKVLMGADTDVFGIAFDPILTITDTMPVWQQVFFNLVNWLETNWKGMTFGLLFGAVLMTLFTFLQQRTVKNRFVNSFMGMAMGAPLGVCVNCATPIAQGMQAAGSRVEMSLAALFSSPTLNFIVLTMLFSFFPPYVGVLKLALTFLFILYLMPLLVKWSGVKAVPPALVKNQAPMPYVPTLSAHVRQPSWWAAARWSVDAIAQSFWHLVKIAVPLMLLAGALGALLTTLIPFNLLAGLLPASPIWIAIICVIAVAILGAFLPVPMSFDIIIVLVLLQAGLPVAYGLTLLFALGIFSAYPFFIIWRDLSPKLAMLLAIGVVLFAVANGVVGHSIDKWQTERNIQFIYSTLQQAETPPLPSGIPPLSAVKTEAVLAGLQPNRRIAQSVLTQDNVTVTQASFETSISANGSSLFTAYSGEDWGIQEGDQLSMLKFMESGTSYFRGIGTGDVHQDGWNDLIVASDVGFSLYANQQGKKFVKQAFSLPSLTRTIGVSAALVDMDNDGWLDIFCTTLRQGSYIVYNNRGSFEASRVQKIPNLNSASIVVAPAFGDLDKDGDLDIVLGNWSVGNLAKRKSLPTSQNAWVENQPNGFLLHPLPGTPGETLTTALTDVDQDGSIDLIVGNDFIVGDQLYLGSGTGDWQQVMAANELMPSSGRTTMSIATADINNDLTLETYIGQISKSGDEQARSPAQRCEVWSDRTQQQDCHKAYEFQQEMLQATRNNKSPAACNQLSDSNYQESCVGLHLFRAIVDGKITTPDVCNRFNGNWSDLRLLCQQAFQAGAASATLTSSTELPSVGKKNILYVQSPEGLVNQASQFNLETVGWTWNAKFADLDNDTWQDLYVVNGMFSNGLQVESNHFFQNIAGRTFEEKTEKEGLTSYLETGSYSYSDLDNDGDLDIVTVPAVGPLLIYINQTAEKKAIQFSLDDERGNRYGIGSKIIIHYGNGLHQMREITASGGYQSFDAPVAHFGLAEQAQVDRVEVQWYDGETTAIETPLSAGSQYRIRREAA